MFEDNNLFKENIPTILMKKYLSPIKIMCNSLSGLVFEGNNTIIYTHSIEPIENFFRLDLTDLNTGERRKEIPTEPFFNNYQEVLDKSLVTKGFYKKVCDLRLADCLYEQSQPLCIEDKYREQEAFKEEEIFLPGHHAP